MACNRPSRTQIKIFRLYAFRVNGQNNAETGTFQNAKPTHFCHRNKTRSEWTRTQTTNAFRTCLIGCWIIIFFLKWKILTYLLTIHRDAYLLLANISLAKFTLEIFDLLQTYPDIINLLRRT
jgi:hypothetical protein